MMRGLLGGGAASKIAHPGGDKGAAPEGAAATETEELDEKEGSVLMGIISQLRPGMELSRITFPTFVLEPRSMLERITDFLAHPDLIFGAGRMEDADERYIAVLRYYLAGWHIKPKGVKKPYNPVLGEIFRCRYKYQDGTRGFYIAEQVSHHPPISAFYYVSPENQIEIFGELRPKSRFLGNSVVNEMGGYNHIVLLDRPDDGEYDISMPNMYARGILFGKMVLELGDVASVSNRQLGVSCDVDFKTKGFFSGSYNTIAGKVRSQAHGDIGEISGKWSDQMYMQRSGRSAQKELFFDADKATPVPKEVMPESEQQDNESRRLWAKVTAAIKKGDQDAATDSKSAIEDRQRELAKLREDAGEEWRPHYFSNQTGEHRAKFTLPKGTVDEQIKAVEEWIFGSSSDSASSKDDAAASSKAVSAEESTGDEGQAQSVAAPQEVPSSTAAADHDAKVAASSSPPSTQPAASTSAPTPHSQPAPAAAVAMASQPSNASSADASSPDTGSGHGHGHFFKLGGRKKHTGSISSSYLSLHKSSAPPSGSSAPDHEASSRHLPPPNSS